MVRRARELDAEQKSMVSAVKRIARQRARVNASYVSAILQARDSGVTYAAIAQAVGTSSQAVQEIVRRHSRGLDPVTRTQQTDVGAETGVELTAVAGTDAPSADAQARRTSENDAVAL